MSNVMRQHAEQQFAEGAAAVRDHHDHVAAMLGGQLDDGGIDIGGARMAAGEGHAGGTRCLLEAAQHLARMGVGARGVAGAGSAVPMTYLNIASPASRLPRFLVP